MYDNDDRSRDFGSYDPYTGYGYGSSGSNSGNTGTGDYPGRYGTESSDGYGSSDSYSSSYGSIGGESEKEPDVENVKSVEELRREVRQSIDIESRAGSQSGGYSQPFYRRNDPAEVRTFSAKIYVILMLIIAGAGILISYMSAVNDGYLPSKEIVDKNVTVTAMVTNVGTTTARGINAADVEVSYTYERRDYNVHLMPMSESEYETFRESCQGLETTIYIDPAHPEKATAMIISADRGIANAFIVFVVILEIIIVVLMVIMKKRRSNDDGYPPQSRGIWDHEF